MSLLLLALMLVGSPFHLSAFMKANTYLLPKFMIGSHLDRTGMPLQEADLVACWCELALE